jgi:hypothetical protein
VTVLSLRPPPPPLQYAEWANEWENHRTQTEFEDAMIFKVFLFQLFNNYAALFFIAFVKSSLWDGCDSGDCMGELFDQMVSIFLVRFAMNTVEIGGPLVGVRRAQPVGRQGWWA